MKGKGFVTDEKANEMIRLLTSMDKSLADLLKRQEESERLIAELINGPQKKNPLESFFNQSLMGGGGNSPFGGQ